MSAGTVVGIDGGGTRTRAVVLDATGRELARRDGPAGIVQPADPCGAAEAAADLTRAVLADAGVAGRAAVLCCGLAGAGRWQEREAVRVGLMLAGVADRALVVGDAETALADAFGADAGVLVIAGTGSIAWAQAGSDTSTSAGGDDGAEEDTPRVTRVGGWGELLDDEGSGYAIGLGALRCIARAADGRDPPTTLAAAVLAATGVGAVEDLIRYAATASKAEVAALAPVVLRCAVQGDAAAGRVRTAAVDALAELVVTAAARAALPTPRLAFAGGLIGVGGPLREELAAALAVTFPQSTLLDRMVDAARGAALLAIRHAADTP